MMMNISRITPLLIFIGVLVNGFSVASAAYVIDDNSLISSKVPAPQVRVIEDKGGTLGIEQLKDNMELFGPLSALGELKTDYHYWLATQVENRGSIDRQLILDKLPNWDEFRAYIIKSDGSIKIIDRNQSAYDSAINPSVENNLATLRIDQFESRYAKFDLARGESVRIILSVKADHHFKHPDLSINIADFPKYLELKRQSLYFEGIMLGAIASLLIFSIYNAIIFRDGTSVSYALWLLSSCLLPISSSMLDGQRLNEFFVNVSDLKIAGIDFDFFVLYVAGCLQNILYIVFAQLFLGIKSKYPVVDKVLKNYIVFVIVYYAFQLFVKYDFHANYLWVPFYVTHVVVLLLILGCGAIEALKGERSANFFIAGLIPYIVFRIFYALGIVKWWSPMVLLPDFGLLHFLKNSAGIQQVLSITLEAIVISFAVADRTKSLQDKVAQSIQNQKKLIEDQNRILEVTVAERTMELDAKRANIQELLYNVMPISVAEELEVNGAAPPIRHDSVTILFTDFVGFTQASSIMPANRMVAELNEIFGAFDRITEEFGVEKIKTIGDAYMAVAGAPVFCEDHAIRCARAALRMIDFIQDRNRTATFKWSLRVGLHSGPVVAGVIGTKRIAYDIWGDSVNLASRMESSSEANRVNISAYTFDLIRHQFECEYRGKIPTKGKGDIDMYFIAA